MNRHETKTWLNYHLSLFPDFKVWWEATQVEQRAVLWEAWIKVLRRVELSDCSAASEAILAGEQKKPWNHEDTPASIAKAAISIHRQKQPTPRVVEGQQTFSCPDCQDTGWIERPYPSSAGPVYGDGLHFYAKTCRCLHGDKHRGRPWGSPQASVVGQ